MECYIVHGTDPGEVEAEVNEWLEKSEKNIPGFKVFSIKQSIAPPDSPHFSRENPNTQPDFEPWLVVSIWFEKSKMEVK